MSISCLACNPPKVSLYLISRKGSSTEHGLVLPLTFNQNFGRSKLLFSSSRNHVNSLTHGYAFKRRERSKSSIYASFSAIFPRINVKDPYQQLGISKEASVDEIQAARNFLVNKYAGHQPSIDAIESAHTKIIMQSFYDRKNPKIDLKKKMRDVSQSKVVKAVASRFETPAMKVILKTSIAFIVLGVLTVLFPTEEGPTLQVAISLILSVHFIHDRLKSWIRALLYGFGSFFASWLLGTFFMVSVIPPLLKGPRSLEVSTSLLSYILLWVSSTYLK